MKFRNIFWGVILIFIGILFFLQNLHLIHFEWINLWRLWPVIFVLWGISILPTNSWLKLILTMLVLGVSLFFVVNQTSSWNNLDENVEWWRNWDKSNKAVLDQYFDVPYEDSAQNAMLSLDAAAGSFLINQSTNELVEFDKKGSWTNYTYLVKKLDDKTEVMIEPEGDHINIIKGKNKNNVNISLNKFPVWDMTLDVGASSMDFDLTDFKVKKLDIDGGAASFEIKLGDLYPDTHISIDAGASSIKLQVPESSGCDLQISTVLSGREISGFEKIDHGHYQTENFGEAVNKIYIEVDAAVSSYSIIRY